MRTGMLNSPTMVEILENHQVEEDFEPGDVLLFNKMGVHRSMMANWDLVMNGEEPFRIQPCFCQSQKLLTTRSSRVPVSPSTQLSGITVSM